MTFSEYNLSNILHFPTFNGFIANNQIFFRTKFWMLKDSLSVLFFKQACLKPVMAMGINAMNLNMAVYSNLYFLFDRWFQLKIYDLKRGRTLISYIRWQGKACKSYNFLWWYPWNVENYVIYVSSGQILRNRPLSPWSIFAFISTHLHLLNCS